MGLYWFSLDGINVIFMSHVMSIYSHLADALMQNCFVLVHRGNQTTTLALQVPCSTSLHFESLQSTYTVLSLPAFSHRATLEEWKKEGKRPNMPPPISSLFHNRAAHVTRHFWHRSLTDFPSATVRRESLGHLSHNLSLYLSFLPSLCPSLSLSTYLSSTTLQAS